MELPRAPLKEQTCLVVRIANDYPIVTDCANAFHEAGVALAAAYLNDKAKRHVEPVARAIGNATPLHLEKGNYHDDRYG